MLILNGNVFIDGKFIKKDIRIENGKFAEIAEPGKLGGLERGKVLLFGEAEEVLDATDKYVIPGLVDVHTHGRIGLDFSKITEKELEQLLASYKACGVTSVLATTMTNEPAVVEESLQVIGSISKNRRNLRVIPVQNFLVFTWKARSLAKKKRAPMTNHICKIRTGSSLKRGRN